MHIQPICVIGHSPTGGVRAALGLVVFPRSTHITSPVSCSDESDVADCIARRLVYTEMARSFELCTTANLR